MDNFTFDDSDLFRALILNFQMSAMIGMGKIVNPVTQKVERNLEDAKRSIDMANMLANKTKGNLSDDEEKFLEHVLTELRLNYVQEASRPEPATEPEAVEKDTNTVEQPEDKSDSSDETSNKN